MTIGSEISGSPALRFSGSPGVPFSGSRPGLIILGASARAAAQSAIRAGYEPWCIDLFADRDLRAIAPVERCPRDRYPEAMIDMLKDYPGPSGTPVLLTGAMENHLDVVERIAQRFPLLGCDVASMRAVRTPHVLASLPSRFDQQDCSEARDVNGWMIKPVRSAGGRGVTRVNCEKAPQVDEQHYVQPFVVGMPVSVIVSDRMCVISEQIIGDPRFGADGFRYVGNLWSARMQDDCTHAASVIVSQLCSHFPLTGIWGLDAIKTKDGQIVPIEINPRYVASVELTERTFDDSLLPSVSGGKRASTRTAPPTDTFGKAIVYAKAPCRVIDIYELFTKDDVADVPDPGEPIDAGDPICTVFARGNDCDDCLARLHDMADRIYTRLQP